MVFIGSDDDNVYALNAVTGALVWKYQTGGMVDPSSPAVANGIVYVGSQDDKVYAFGLARTLALSVVSFTIGRYNVEVDCHNTYYDTGQHYVTFDVYFYPAALESILENAGYRGGIRASETYQLSTAPYSYDWLFANSTSSWLPPPNPNPNPDAIRPLQSTYPGGDGSGGPVNPLTDYTWNNIYFAPCGTWTLSNGQQVTIKYDHPDNYQVYNSNTGASYTIVGSNGYYALHLTTQQIANALNTASITGIIGALLSIAGFVADAVVGDVIGVIGAILSGLSCGIQWFVSNVVETELGDGWAYLWGAGSSSWWIFHSEWFWLSFGSWRNWGWYFYVVW
jgi:hypothetical protein